MIPKRIKLSRRKGWRIPANTLIVSRPHKLGNPFKVGEKDLFENRPMTQVDAVYYHEMALREMPEDDKARLIEQLSKYEYLACWCALDEPCHADNYINLVKGDIK